MFILIDEKKKLSTQPKDKTDKQINKQTNTKMSARAPSTTSVLTRPDPKDNAHG